MGGFLGFGNSASKTDRANQLQAFSDLGKVTGMATDAAPALGASGASEKALGLEQKATGLSDLDKARAYWSTLLSGNRQQTAAAVAPAANAAVAQADAAKRQMATLGTGRTGGGVAGAQQIDDNVRSQIDTLIGAAKPAAASHIEGIGVDTANIGANTAAIGAADIQAMLQALNIGETAAANRGQLAGNAKTADQKFEAQRAQQIAQILLAALT